MVAGMLGSVGAQTTTETPQAAAPAPAATTKKSPYVLGPVTWSVTLDGYFSNSFNDPTDGINSLRNFDSRAGQPTLSMGKLTLDMPAAPVGFHFEVGGGKAFNLIELSAPRGGHDGWKQIGQAYISFKPASWKGVQVDVGKFFTSAGAELTDTLPNYNYSRSVLFALGPYYHTGIRTSFPITKTLTGGVQVVEGWNGLDGKNHGVTLGLTTAYTPSPKVSWANTYYTGPEDYYGVRTYRNFYDTALTVNPTSKASFYFNFDYGRDSLPGGGSASYYGPAVAGRYQIAKKFAIAARGEIYKDADGFWTGAERRISEFTLTGEYKHNNYFLTRAEYRRDSTDVPMFNKGPLGEIIDNQGTFLIGAVLFFGPGR
jgi:hypothetical protein